MPPGGLKSRDVITALKRGLKIRHSKLDEEEDFNANNRADLKTNSHDRSKQTPRDSFKEKCFLEAEPSTFNRTKYAPLRIHLPEVPP